MEIELLADNPGAHKVVAKWYFDEWLSDAPGADIKSVEGALSKATNRLGAPLLVLAKRRTTIIGAAELKFHEMDIYPDYEYWLGGVYVENSERGKGIAEALSRNIIARARKAGVKNLYLQTEALSGGLYSACGFRAIEEVEYKGHHVLVMVANLEL